MSDLLKYSIYQCILDEYTTHLMHSSAYYADISTLCATFTYDISVSNENIHSKIVEVIKEIYAFKHKIFLENIEWQDHDCLLIDDRVLNFIHGRLVFLRNAIANTRPAVDHIVIPDLERTLKI